MNGKAPNEMVRLGVAHVPEGRKIFKDLMVFENLRMGYASALAWLLLLIIGAFTGLAFLTSRYWVYYEDEGR